MIFSMTTFTFVHVVLSLAQVVVMLIFIVFGVLAAKRFSAEAAHAA